MERFLIERGQIMILKDLKIVNFRNYDVLSLSLHPKVNIIYGENGQGKSNLLESIYVLGFTKSHRSVMENALIKETKEFSKITGTLQTNTISKKMEIILTKDSKKLKMDEHLVKKVSEYISNLDVIIFYPEDLDIVKGSPLVRRKFINTELSGLQSIYYTVLTDYNKLLKMRNEYLKQSCFDENYFSILTKYFMEKALLLYKMRNKFIDRINEYVEDIYYHIMHLRHFKVIYKIEDVNFEGEYDINILQKHYENIKEKERLQRKTLFGPHRDDLLFYLNEQDMNSFASQGQQRSAVLAFKLAEIELYKKFKEETPILLLDDVFSELDHSKRENLINYIGNHIQTIITTTDLDLIKEEILKKAKLIQIKNGNIISQEEVK